MAPLSLCEMTPKNRVLFWGWNVKFWWPAHRRAIKPMEMRRKLDKKTWKPLQNLKRHSIHKHQKGNAATFNYPPGGMIVVSTFVFHASCVQRDALHSEIYMYNHVYVYCILYMYIIIYYMYIHIVWLHLWWPMFIHIGKNAHDKCARVQAFKLEFKLQWVLVASDVGDSRWESLKMICPQKWIVSGV